MATDVAPVVPPHDNLTEEVPTVGSTRGARWRFGRKQIVVATVAVVALAGTGIGISLGTTGSSTSPLQITTQVVAVTTGTMQQTVSTSGTIEPSQQANLNFAVSGTITAVDVSTGQTVTTGQTLATVDQSALQAQLAAAEATLTAAQARLAGDQADGAAASQLDSDGASVTSAQTQVTSAETNLSDASLTSTISGTVASVDLSVGQQVSGGSSSAGSGASGSGAAAAVSSSGQVVVIATNSYVVGSTVDDTQIGQVRVGDQAVITPTGSRASVYGTVSSLGLIATQSSNVATFPVQIAVTGTPGGLYAGATATVSIVVRQINGAVEVPTASISYSSGGQATVTVVENGGHVSQPVTTGVSASGETQITKGLGAGAKIMERVVKFNGAAVGGARSLFGGTGSSGSFGGGNFPAGGRFGGGSVPGGGGLGG
ncbi:MAG TPA: biotin/lipoyl-binding protein [Acidimicrobiales bacterium]|nr:biotin/lipoyl-binding protein [Acidimicrobiales bacterium]